MHYDRYRVCWGWTILDKELRLELLNETGFWSKWARLKWEGKERYVVTWSEFKEPLFNHVGLLGRWTPTESYLKRTEKVFTSLGVNPSFFIPEFEEYEDSLKIVTANGYKKADSLEVYRSLEEIEPNEEVMIRVVGVRGLGEWSRIYMRAFYEGGFLNRSLVDALRRAVKSKKTKFIIAKVGGLPVGCTALYTTKGYTGAFCVGVLEEYRNRGVAKSMLAYSKKVAEEAATTLVVQTFSSDGLKSFYERLGFSRMFSRSVLVKKIIEYKSEDELGLRLRPRVTQTKPLAAVKLDVRINRSLELGEYSFLEAFPGFEKLRAVREIFEDDTPEILRKVKIVLDPREGYLHVDNEDGTIYMSQPYLKNGEEVYIYLDLIHELVHVKQFMQGKELYDMRYEYLERPTELEAYRVGVKEARRLGLTDEQIADYLRVDWVNEDEFAEFLKKMKVNPPA